MMDDDRRLDHDGLLKESSISSITAGLRRTTAFLRRALPVVIACLVVVAVLIVAVLAVLIRQDAKSYQSVQLQADKVFAEYGAPPDHGQEWTCSEFVSNIQCWDGTYTYLYTPSGWTQLSGPEEDDDAGRKLFTVLPLI